jgi:hypothetical protein
VPRFDTTQALCERPPSDDRQHLPFILVAVAGVKADDRATADIASDKMTASDFIFLSLDLWPAHTITGIPLNKQAFSSQPLQKFKLGPYGLNKAGSFPSQNHLTERVEAAGTSRRHPNQHR